MHISPENCSSDNKKTNVANLSFRYARLFKGVRLNKDGTTRVSKNILGAEARLIFETRSTIARALATMPNIHYWITQKSDEQGKYWQIQLHPVCASFLNNLEHLDKCFGKDMRFKVSIKDLGK